MCAQDAKTVGLFPVDSVKIQREWSSQRRGKMANRFPRSNQMLVRHLIPPSDETENRAYANRITHRLAAKVIALAFVRARKK
jgi:hypothetical protein